MKTLVEISLFASFLAFSAAASADHPVDIHHDTEKIPRMSNEEYEGVTKWLPQEYRRERPILIIHVFASGNVSVRACPGCREHPSWPPTGSDAINDDWKATIDLGEIEKYHDADNPTGDDPCFRSNVAGNMRIVCF